MNTEISPAEIGQILDAIHKLDCAAVEVTVGDLRIAVRRDRAGDAFPAVTAPALADSQAARATLSPAASTAKTTDPLSNVQAAPQTAAPDAAALWLERESEGKVRVIRAPMIGTFYRAKAPGEPPFVEVDASVRNGDTVGLVEAMKLFNSVLAECSGKVGAIFAANGEMVEYGQPVLAIWKE